VNSYAAWLLDCIARLRRDRRLASYARYRASAKGWERTRRYNDSFAHQEACRRYRESHCRGPLSYQTHAGRWVGLMKVDPADKTAALWETQRGGGWGGASAAERMVSSLGHNPAALHDEEVWNTLHARVGKSFSNDHVRRFRIKKLRAADRQAARDTNYSNLIP